MTILLLLLTDCMIFSHQIKDGTVAMLQMKLAEHKILAL